MKHYQQIEGCTYSKIDLAYQLGGINWFSGGHEARGIYIHFTKVEKTNSTESFGLFADSSYKVLAKVLNRRSAKQERIVWSLIESHLDELHQLHIEGKRNTILKKIGQILNKERLEYLRKQFINENISYGEIQELQSLKDHIESSDVQLLQWAGVEEVN